MSLQRFPAKREVVIDAFGAMVVCIPCCINVTLQADRKREWDDNDNEDVNALFNTVDVGFVTFLSLLLTI